MKKIEIAGKKFSPEEKIIDLSNRGIKEIPDLSAFKTLKELDLSNNYISKINKFSSSEKIEKLNLNNNSIKKIENLSRFSNLKDLSLSGNLIKRIENIEKLDKLEYLDLEDNDITKINVIPKNIHELFLSGNKVSEIPDLTYCNRLYKLIIENNNISAFSFDRLPKKLLILFLNGNKIKKLKKPSAPHNYLDDISMSGNLISKLEWIELLPKLTHILIDGKNLKEISGATYEFILKKQNSKKGRQDDFLFWTSPTTTSKRIDKFVNQAKKIKIT